MAPNKTKLKLCPFGEKCYRKNPIHFGEFSHPHLDKIYENGLNPDTNEYNIPSHLIAELITIQLKLLEKLFPKDTPSKVSSETEGNAAVTSERHEQTVASHEGYKSEASTSKHEQATSHSIVSSISNYYSTDLSGRSETSNLSKKQKISKDARDYIAVIVEKGRMAAKLESSAPYNLFLTAITDSKPTHSEPLSVTFQEILDESLGEVECSVQINFMVDIGWVLGHYYFAGILDTPLIVLYGEETRELLTISRHKPQVTAIKVSMKTPFATSHTKMMLFGYKDGSMRVVISTANLYEDDWHNRTQGIWISPKLEPLSDEADIIAGESPTEFRENLLLYLLEYKIEKLQPWIVRIRKTDFSDINVFFIGSVPGGHRDCGPKGYYWGHPRLGSLLQKHTTPIDERIPIVCQSSSIGSLGPNVQAWVQHDFLNSLRKDTQRIGIRQFPPFKMIYPSFGNVCSSHDGMLGGGCLPYAMNTNEKQPWLKQHLYQWKSNDRHRSQAMPHIKSYTRFDQEEHCIYWFVLTSANLSKAAWGAFNKNSNIQACLRINNFEAGVLFLPKFVTGEETFPIGSTRDGVPPFPMPYDIPLTLYDPDDTPFVMDYLQG